MKLPVFAGLARGTATTWLCACALLWTGALRADQVETTNGDRYVGRVLSLSGETLLLQSEVLGTLRLPRSRISTITLQPQATSVSGTNLARFTLTAPRSKLASGTNRVQGASAVASTNASTEFAAMIQQLGANSNVLRQVQDQFITGAGPEAQSKFNDLLGGLLSGKVDLAGLREQARSTLDQARKVRGDLGEEGGGMMDSYLAILDSFLKETESDPAATNSTPAVSPPPAQKPLPEE